MVHQLAELYHLKSKSYGTGRHRFPTLVKTIYTCYPPQSELFNFLNRAATVRVLSTIADHLPYSPKFTQSGEVHTATAKKALKGE